MKKNSFGQIVISASLSFLVASCGKEEKQDCGADFQTELQKLNTSVKAITTSTGADALLEKIAAFEAKWNGEECMGSRERGGAKVTLNGKDEATRLRDTSNRAKAAYTKPNSNPTSTPTPTPTPTPTVTVTPVPTVTPTPTPTPIPTSTVTPAALDVTFYEYTDSCSGSPLGYATLSAGTDSLTQCQSQVGTFGSRSVWSIRINGGACINISDTNAISACTSVDLPVIPGRPHVQFYEYSDSCAGQVSGAKIFNLVDPTYQQCQDFAHLGSRTAWSIKIDGVCRNISDTDTMSACVNMGLPIQKKPLEKEILVYSYSDSCSGTVHYAGTLRTDQDLFTQCSNLTRLKSGALSAWSIQLDGVCQNISDTDYMSACLDVSIPSQVGQSQVQFYPYSDSCAGSISIAGYLPRGRPPTWQECQALPKNPQVSGGNSVWSVKVDGVCRNISDTTFDAACAGL